MQISFSVALALCSASLFVAACSSMQAKPVPPVGSMVATASIPTIDLDGKPIAVGRLATVCYFAGPECPISRAYAPEVARLAQRDQARDIAWVMVFSESGMTREIVKEFQRDYSLALPSVIDSTQQLACALGALTIPTVVVIDGSGTMLYRGRIDNRYQSLALSYGPPTQRDLADVVDALAAGTPLPPIETLAIGCVLPPCK